MKTLIIIILLFVGTGKASTQSYMQLQTYQDTANYLIHEIEMKKNLFNDNPFSVLLDSLKISSKKILIGSIPPFKQGDGKSIILDFNLEEDFSSAHFIVVDFQEAPALNTLVSLYNQDLTVTILHQFLNLYKPLLIKDVMVKDYTGDEPPKPGITDNSNL